MATRAHLTDYLAPVSLWVVIRRHEVNVIEAAITGCKGNHEEVNHAHECTAGPIIFPSRVHAEIYAHFRNAHAASYEGWHLMALEDYGLREHIRVRGGSMPFMLAIGFSTSKAGALLLPYFSPSVLSAVHRCATKPGTGNIISFKNVMENVLKEWASIGLHSFEDKLQEFDSLDSASRERVVARAIARTSVERSHVANPHWGVYCPIRERWFVEEELKVFAKESALR
jgi:hypothetical protein